MPIRSHRPLLLTLVCAATWAACGGADEAPTARDPAPVAAAPPSSPAALATPEADLPPPGDVRARLESDRAVTVLANQAPRGAIVTALAEATGFELVLGKGSGLEQPLTLRSEREPLEIVLARILGGVSHAVTYETDPASGAPRVARLTLGLVDTGPKLASVPDRVGPRERSRPELTPEEREARAEREHELRVESVAKLASADPEERADGAKWLDVNSGEGFQAATEHLASDDSPEVRAAAAEVLGESGVGAVQPLLKALNDPDSRVVLAALDALEFVGDETTAPLLAPLLKHKDVEVRERTVEAMEFLQ